MDSRGDREVDALRRVRHPQVVGFHGYGLWPDDEPHYLVLALELVEGRPLDVWMRERNPTALELVRQVLLPLARALGVVHAAGVVHRDVKESNILIRDSDGQPVLVDFGAAGFEGATRLTAVASPGDPRVPESRGPALRAESGSPGPYPAGPGDDLWALGVVLYFLLTRTLPFGDRHSPGMVHAILYATPRPPQELNPRVPEALSELCLCMLEKHPEARYANARELAEVLEEWTQADRSGASPLPRPRRGEPRPPPATREETQHRPVPRCPRCPRRTGSRAVADDQTRSRAAVLAWCGDRLSSNARVASPGLPQKASDRQESAPAQATAEVGNDAGPQSHPRRPSPARRPARNPR